MKFCRNHKNKTNRIFISFFLKTTSTRVRTHTKMSEEPKPKKKEDPRVDIISNYVLKTMRLKAEKWQKLMSTEELKVKYILITFAKRAYSKPTFFSLLI